MSDDRTDRSQTLLDVRAAQRGERDATERLFARQTPRLRAIVALQLGGCPQQAEVEDVVQETLLRAYQRLGRYREQKDATFRGWLARIALNLLRDDRRRSGRKKRGAGRVATFGDEPEVPALDPSPTQMARVRELEEAERHAIATLSHRQRRAVLLRDFQGLDYAAIAAELGFRTEAPVRALYSRARQRIREAMAGFDDAESNSRGFRR